MFDVTTARQIDYGPDSEHRVTVFQDRTEKNIWYMVPVPRLRMPGGQPAFGLTRYLSNDSIAGVCTFEVELYSPSDAKRAAEKEIGSIEAWGDFTWISGDAFFDPDFLSDETAKVGSIAQSPSLFGSNVAFFQVELPTAADVEAFEKAFTGPGSLSTCHIAYDMGVLTQLLAASARVQYRSSIAIDYERKYITKRDTWGNKKTVLAEVRQILKRSGAGDVQVTKGVGATDMLEQLVNDWAWTTLENRVAEEVEDARQLAEGDSPVSATSDFTANYSEDAIVEWSTPVSTLLPAFDDATWTKLYREVDNRELVVTFQLCGEFMDGSGAPLYQDIEIEVEYPTKTTDNTFLLIPGTDDRTAKTYVAPGGGTFDPTYRYRYTVNFPGGVPPYTAEWISETSTQISLRPNLFGIRSVSFIGSNVPFDTTVDRVFIDFFDNPPAGQPPKLQTREMLENETPVRFTTTYHVPITNTYDYRLRYLLKNGKVIVVQPGEQFGSNNADTVMVLDPAPSLASLSLVATVTEDGGGFMAINANATYYDDQNQPGRPRSHDWSGFVPGEAKGSYPAESWYFDAQPDTRTAYFDVNGQIVYGDGETFDLSNFKLGYRSRPLAFMDTESLLSLEIFPEQIDWSVVEFVTLNIRQPRDSNGGIIAEGASAPVPTLAQLQDPETATRYTLPIAYKYFPPAPELNVLPSFYTLRVPRTSGNVEFLFNGTYLLADGTRRSMPDTTVTDRLQIHLPPLPPEGPPDVVQRIVVPVPVPVPASAADAR